MSSIYVSYPEQWQFNEVDYIHSLQSLQHLRDRLHVLARHLIRQIPGDGRFRYFPMSYHFTAFSLAHIMDRHHHSIDKFPGRSKFTISIPEITWLIKEAFFAEQHPIQKAFIYSRTHSAGRIIGTDQKGNPCRNITVITDQDGNIKSAYPTC